MTPRNDFEAEVIRFMARIDEHMANQGNRCNSHAVDIRSTKDRVTSLENTRTFVKGMLAMGSKITVVAGAASGMIITIIKYFGPHVEKAVK